jgi:PAS domain S-box-containing protein
MIPPAYTLLLIEDSVPDREWYRSYLLADSTCTYRLLEADSAAAGLELCRSHSINAILLDDQLPDANGLEFLEALSAQSNGASPSVVLVAGEGAAPSTIVRAVKLGAEDYLLKSDLTSELLQMTMRRTIENRPLQQELGQTEVALKAANEQITTIWESMTDAYTTLDRDWRFVYTNPASTQVIRRLTNQESEEFLGKTHWETLPWTVGTIVEREYRRAMAEQVAVHFELFYEPSGDWFQVHAYPSQAGLGIYFRDINDRKRNEAAQKQIEAALQESEQRFRAIFNTTFQFVGLLSPDGILLEANQTALDFGGLTREEAVGRPFWEVRWWTISPHTQQQLQAAIAQARQGDFVRYEVEVLGDGETTTVIDFSLKPVRDDSGQVVLLIPEGRDIRDRVRNERDRKQIEANLRKREEQLRLFVKHAPAGVAMFDREMRYVEVSDRWITSYGLDEQDLIGRSHYEIFPEIPDRWKAIHQRCLAGAVEICEEDQFPRADGSIDWLRWEIHPWRTNTDEIGGIIIFSEVITDRKQAESRREFLATVSQALIGTTSIQKMVQTIGEHLNRYLNTSRFSLVEIDEAANQAYVNHTWQLPGVPSLVGVYQIQEFITDELRQAIRNGEMIVFRDVTTDPRIVDPMRYIALGIGAELNAPLVRDGEWKFSIAVFHATPYNWQTSDLELMRELLERIWSQIERIRAETALRESEARYRMLTELVPQIVWTARPDGYLDYFNQRWAEFAGVDPAETEGWSWQPILHPEDQQRTVELWTQATQTGQLYECEHRVRNAAGEYRWLLSRAMPLRDKSGSIVKWFGTATDIHTWKQLEIERTQLLSEAEAAREEAEAANRSKDEFVAVVAHELRSPLNAISGWAKLLQTHKFDEDKRSKALDTIWRNTQTQVQLIEDLLDISRLVKGTLQINSAPVDLTQVIEAVLNNIRPIAEAKNIQLQLHLTVTPLISGDFNRLQQVVVNLLNNAIKFTPTGGRVEIALEQVNAAVRLQVRDTGKGIAPEFLPYIFERFKQGQQNTGSKDGLGLGLAIVKNLVELHGGTITAESAGIDQGTTFTVRLPRLEVPAIERSRSTSPIHQNALTGIRILAVDDEPDMLSLITFVLQDFGAEVKSVTTAMAALDCLSQFKPDILISDLAMPGCDGYELVQQVKSDPEGQIPVIALTSYASATYEERSLQAGFQRHLTKPVEPQVLVTAILDLIGARNYK